MGHCVLLEKLNLKINAWLFFSTRGSCGIRRVCVTRIYTGFPTTTKVRERKKRARTCVCVCVCRFAQLACYYKAL